MPVVRKIVESNELAKIVELPKEMRNMMVELIIRPVKKKEEEEIFDPKMFRGILQSDNIDEEIKQIRTDWERTSRCDYCGYSNGVRFYFGYLGC